MIIGVDGNEANIKKLVGVGYFASRLLNSLSKNDNKNTYWIYLKQKPLPHMPAESKNWKYIIFGPQKLWTRFALPIKLYTQTKKPDIFFSPSHYTPLFCPIPKIVSIMDLGYLETPEQFTKKDFYQLKNWTEQSIKSSQHILTISEFNKQDLIKKYNISEHKITVVYPITTPPIKINDKLISKWKLKPKNYFLFLGTLKPNKNVPFLLESFARTGLKDQLVIAGKKGWLFENVFTKVKELKLEKQVIFTDYINDSEKWSLLKNAKVLLIPSLFEGFGMPAVESMYFDVPVISSSRGSLPEINQSYGQIIEPTNHSQLQKAILNIKKPKTKLPKKFTEKEILKSFLGIINNVSRQKRQ